MIVANWIQAVGAAALVFLTRWTLKVLREYPADTKTIAQAGASQTENSQMPFLAVDWIVDKIYTGWSVQNQGFGPAINVAYSINALKRRGETWLSFNYCERRLRDD